MAFVHVVDGEVVTVAPSLPNAARLIGSRAWVLNFPRASVDLQEACGWFAVTDTPQPPDTATTTHVGSVTLVDDVATETWTPRPWTPAELAARTAAINGDTIRTRVADAIAVNRAFLALVSPTNAQVVAYVRAIAPQLIGLERLTLGDLAGTD
jgi:hypothetical protein